MRFTAATLARELKHSRVVLKLVPDRTSGKSGRKERWRGVTATALLLLVGSLIPLPPRRNPDFGPYGPDKFLHLLGHAGFAAALVAAFDDTEPSFRGVVVAVVVSTVYGVGTELLQEAIPGREFERGDVIAGLVGSIIGALATRARESRYPQTEGRT